MESYDCAIIGAGVTGFAAGMYAGRLALKTVVIGDKVGGTIILTDRVENYPGFKLLTGQQLADNIREHALEYNDFVSTKNKLVTKISRDKDNECFLVAMGDEKIRAKTIIYATGTKWRELTVPGHDTYMNKGVHYCALCDGFFYRGKTVAVVGGSDSAGKDALVLAEHAEKVYIIYRGDKIHPEPPTQRRIEASNKIEIINHTNITEIKGNDQAGVTSVVLDTEYSGSKELKLDGVFVAIGHIALTDLAKELGVKTNAKGEIIIDRKAQTNIPGFFSAGDCTDTHFKQAIVGVGEGVLAAYGSYEYVSDNDIVCPADTGEYK